MTRRRASLSVSAAFADRLGAAAAARGASMAGLIDQAFAAGMPDPGVVAELAEQQRREVHARNGEVCRARMAAERNAANVDADLVELHAAYLPAREAAVRLATLAPENTPEGTCRYCGRSWWRRSQRSALDGHAKCLVTPEWKLTLVAAMARNPALTFGGVAKKLGITYGIARGWWLDGEAARIAARTAA